MLLATCMEQFFVPGLEDSREDLNILGKFMKSWFWGLDYGFIGEFDKGCKKGSRLLLCL